MLIYYVVYLVKTNHKNELTFWHMRVKNNKVAI